VPRAPMIPRPKSVRLAGSGTMRHTAIGRSAQRSRDIPDTSGRLSITNPRRDPPCSPKKIRLASLRTQLPTHFSPHSFRVTTVTDLLKQNVPLEDVQYLAGHSDPRTTRIYDRRRREVTRNIVERISI
jgi:integrase